MPPFFVISSCILYFRDIGAHTIYYEVPKSRDIENERERQNKGKIEGEHIGLGQGWTTLDQLPGDKLPWKYKEQR